MPKPKKCNLADARLEKLSSLLTYAKLFYLFKLIHSQKIEANLDRHYLRNGKANILISKIIDGLLLALLLAEKSIQEQIDYVKQYEAHEKELAKKIKIAAAEIDEIKKILTLMWELQYQIITNSVIIPHRIIHDKINAVHSTGFHRKIFHEIAHQEIKIAETDIYHHLC